MQEDICRHQHGIGKQTCIYIFGVLAHLILKRCGTLQLADVGVHTEQQRQLSHLRHIALHIDSSRLGVDACCKVLCQNLTHIAVESLGVGVCGEGVVVGNKEVALLVVLHLYKVTQCAKIVAQVEFACRANTTDHRLSHTLFHIFFLF